MVLKAKMVHHPRIWINAAGTLTLLDGASVTAGAFYQVRVDLNMIATSVKS